jgi:transcriptional regulator NrdR family protein
MDGESVWRRRECLACKYRYSTVEVAKENVEKTVRSIVRSVFK